MRNRSSQTGSASQESCCVRVESIQDLNRLKVLSSEWDDVARSFRTPLLLHAWFVACAETLHAEDRLSVCVIRSDEKVSAIAPLVTVRKGGIEHVEFLGASTLGEPSGLIYAGEEPLEQLVRAVVAFRRPITLRRIDAESIQRRILAETCRGHAFILFRRVAKSLWLNIPRQGKSFDESFPCRRLRRKQKQAERMGNVAYEVVSPSLGSLEKHLRELSEVEDAGWKGRRGTSILSQPKIEQFLLHYARAAVKNGTLRLFFMRVDGKAVAARMAVVHERRLWEIKIGYDERFARCSPGLLLTHETLRYAFEQGLEAYEFLGHDEPWEYLWADQSHSYVAAHIYPYSLSGAVALGMDIARLGRKSGLKLVRAISSYANRFLKRMGG